MRLRLIAPLAIVALGMAGCQVSGSIGGTANDANEAATNEAVPAEAAADANTAANANADAMAPADDAAANAAAPAEGDAGMAEGNAAH